MSSLSAKVVSVYRHVQDVASTTWTVEHWLGENPSVDVIVTEQGSQVKMIPASIQHTNVNTLVITFSTARSGVAVVS